MQLLRRRQLNFILKILQQLTSWYTKSAPIHHDHGHRRNLEPGEEITVCVVGLCAVLKNIKKVQYREAILKPPFIEKGKHLSCFLPKKLTSDLLSDIVNQSVA